MLDEGRFSMLWSRLGGQSDPGPLFAALAAAYSEPHRAYHTARHIADCLAQLDVARTAARHPDEAEIALWFHDAIYDPRASDNEEKSAAWAVRELSAGVLEVAARVWHLVLATKHEALPESTDAQIVTDIDLSIFGREPAVFHEYDRAIRTEYQWVPEIEYRQARARILSGFLGQQFIYQSAYFQARYERQARENLERAIAKLSGHVD